MFIEPSVNLDSLFPTAQPLFTLITYWVGVLTLLLAPRVQIQVYRNLVVGVDSSAAESPELAWWLHDVRSTASFPSLLLLYLVHF